MSHSTTIRRITLPLFALAALMLATGPLIAADAEAEQATWTGEILDLACYVAKGAKGEGHAGCAKACVKGGQPMGLLTDDGKVVVLAAHHDDASAFEAAKDLAGMQAEITGILSEKDGIKMVTVLEAKAAA